MNAQAIAAGRDWKKFYADLQAQGSVPNASVATISSSSAIFRDMSLNLADIKEKILLSNLKPVVTTIYADVLTIPEGTEWALKSTALLIYARRIEALGANHVNLDLQDSTSARFVVFALEIVGFLNVRAFTSPTSSTEFVLDQANIAPGHLISYLAGEVRDQILTFAQGFATQIPKDMLLYLNNSFIFGTLLYDQEPDLALSIFLWVKDWAAQNKTLADLFYRSANLVTLLSATINARITGAVFVPFLTATVYTTLATAFAAAADKYEKDYMALSTQQVLTQNDILLAQTMVSTSQAEIDYVTALLNQSKTNYDNAVSAVNAAEARFKKQQQVVDFYGIDLQEIGFPDYLRKQIVKAIFDLVTAVVTFGAGIATMAAGNPGGGAAAAGAGINGAKAVADAATTATEIAKTATELEKTMESLKKLVEMLKQVYDLAKAIKTAADTISSASDQMGTIQEMADTTNGADLSAADGWSIYLIQVEAVLKEPVEKGIQYAAEYLQSIQILTVYGQSLAAAQLAVIKASQEVTALQFQRYYTEQKKKELQALVDSLQVGQAPILSMMQQFYQKYLDSKSSLFSALKSYQASYFYWALIPSRINPKIIDPVQDLSAGIQDITSIALDQANALQHFSPPPQVMEGVTVPILDTAVVKILRDTGEASFVLQLGIDELEGLQRVRLDTVRVWLGTTTGTKSVYVTITTSGNYLDQFKGINYQFNSLGLERIFKYGVSNDAGNAQWNFGNGTYGKVEIDGKVDNQVAYAYFQPTPYSEWKIALPEKFNKGLDRSAITTITLEFRGSAIGSMGFRSRKAVGNASPR